MKCPLCGKETKALVCYRCYTSEGVMVCPGCRDQAEQHKSKPYSKVMDRLAVFEAGYRINRKRARQ